MAIFKKIENDELYVYMNGALIYKKWLLTGQSKVFDIMAYDKYTLTSIEDEAHENSNGYITFRAKLKLKSADEGGRKTPIISGYQPEHVFEYKDNKEPLCTYIGDIIFEGKETMKPGEEKIVTVRFLIDQAVENYLNSGQIWWIHEGSSIIGEAEMV